MSRRLVLAILLALVCGALALSWTRSGNEAGAQVSGGRGARGEQRAVPVVTARAARQDVPIYMSGIGAIKALNTISITPQVNGAITQVAFTEGQMVKRGDLLVQIDPRPYQNALDQTQGQLLKDRANLANAELDLRRYRTLASENSIALQQVDTQAALVQQLQGVVKSDEALVQTAALNLSMCRIESPIAGRTGLRQIDIGNIVQANTTNPIVVVTQLQPISLIFTLPENAFESVRAAKAKGTVPVYAYTQDDTTQLDTGTLLTLDNEIDQATGTIKLKATFPNAALRLWPGEFVNARILLGTEHNVVTAPSVAVQRGPYGQFVFVVANDNVAQNRMVRTGISENGVTVIADGLKPGERVITEGQEKVVAGAHVSFAPILVARAAGRRP
jgi:membrane fusion protein, multidrug efflux system